MRMCGWGCAAVAGTGSASNYPRGGRAEGERENNLDVSYDFCV